MSKGYKSGGEEFLLHRLFIAMEIKTCIYSVYRNEKER